MEISSSINLMVMSFNMRCDSAKNDGINVFANRKPRIAEMLNKYSPDVVGFQEITPTMREWLVDTLADYYTVGSGRNADYSGECELIAFKKNAFDLISCENIMLSATPNVMGSIYEGLDQSHCPRVYTKVLLKHHDIKDPIYFYNVHTDHVGQLARLLASEQILRDIYSHNRNFVMTGDFNATPEATEIKILTSGTPRHIVDASKEISGTFHDYGRRQPANKIDYIFTDSRNKIVECALVEDEPVNEVYLSDHNPIFAVLEMK